MSRPLAASFRTLAWASAMALPLVPAPVIARSRARPESAAPEPERFALAREQIEALIRERDLPSVAVAVAKDGDVLWEAGFGWADREKRIPATPHTLKSDCRCLRDLR